MRTRVQISKTGARPEAVGACACNPSTPLGMEEIEVGEPREAQGTASLVYTAGKQETLRKKKSYTCACSWLPHACYDERVMYAMCMFAFTHIHTSMMCIHTHILSLCLCLCHKHTHIFLFKEREKEVEGRRVKKEKEKGGKREQSTEVRQA